MTNFIRRTARRYLPDKIRKPLGTVAGKFQYIVIQWLMGVIFDLSGGRFKADGCTFTIPKDLTSVRYRACFLHGSYEAEERELIRSYLDKNDSVLELGACLGIVSCVTNKLLANPTRHVVVEGNPFCVPTLHRNRALNKCGFMVENCAVSQQPNATFYLHPVYIVGGSSQNKTDFPVQVPGRSMRELDARYGPFSAFIVDIEGAELEAFENSREALQRCRLVVVELHEFVLNADGVERCRQILRECGLQFVARAGITEAWRRT